MLRQKGTVPGSQLDLHTVQPGEERLEIESRQDVGRQTDTRIGRRMAGSIGVGFGVHAVTKSPSDAV
jgi:hypothetical protein